MAKKILIGVAWPYANGYQHLGHLAGAYLPPDIFARYHRLVGNEVLMVSGSDAHGTPTTVRADQEGVSPREVFERYHGTFLETYQQIGLTFDLFTHTDTENHHRVAQDIFLKILENGYLYKEVQQQLYSPREGRFLPDRYVEGTCPHCGNPDARGDQCDNCGKLLEPTELISPRSKATGDTALELRATEHFFLDLARLSPALKAYLYDNKEYWRPNVLNFARNYVEAGLHGRAFTRDIDWGIPLPLPGYEGKRLYVWFEAVMGYFSASIEWAANQGTPDAWKAWWYDPAVPTYYFVGKDNIPFHTVIWPAELLAMGRLYCDDCSANLSLPYDVPANEFMNFRGQKFSKSRGGSVEVPYFLSRYDPDPLRYYLTAAAPETRDTEFSWEEFVERNNNELVATWGNLANRMLSFAYKHFGQVPEPGDLDEADRELLTKVEAGFETVGELYAACHFRAALSEAIALAREANVYLDRKAPWAQIKQDRAAAATTVYTILRVVDNLKTLLSPVLPHTAQRLHEYLGYDGRLFGTQQVTEYQETTRSHLALTYDHDGAIGTWAPSELQVGQVLRPPAPLFKKLDDSVVEEEYARLGQ